MQQMWRFVQGNTVLTPDKKISGRAAQRRWKGARISSEPETQRQVLRGSECRRAVGRPAYGHLRRYDGLLCKKQTPRTISADLGDRQCGARRMEQRVRKSTGLGLRSCDGDENLAGLKRKIHKSCVFEAAGVWIVKSDCGAIERLGCGRIQEVGHLYIHPCC